MTKPVLAGLPDDVYHDHNQHGHFGIHSLLNLERYGPRYWAMDFFGRFKAEKEKNHLSIGKVCHMITLEGEEKALKEVAFIPETYKAWDKWTKIKAKEQGIGRDNLPEGWRIDEKGFIHEPVKKPWNLNADYCSQWDDSKREQGLTPVTVNDWKMAHLMNHAVINSPVVNEYRCFAPGAPELTVRDVYRARSGSLAIQMRADWMIGGVEPEKWTGITDLKTIDNINNAKRDVQKWGYFRQAAHYIWLAHRICGKWLPFRFVFVEKSPQHRVLVLECSSLAIETAIEMNVALYEKAAVLLAEHIPAQTKAEHWPNGEPEDLQIWSLPDYMARDATDF